MRVLKGKVLILVSALAVSWSFYQIYVAATYEPPTLVHRSIHLGAATMLCLLRYPISKTKKDSRRLFALDFLLASVTVGCFAYVAFDWHTLLWGSASPALWQVIIGGLMILLVLEAVRRSAGTIIPLLAVLAIVYALIGRHMPGLFVHRGYSLERVITMSSLFPSGLFGTPCRVMATYVFMLFLFGAFCKELGMGDLIHGVVMRFLGHRSGGPAKCAVIGSGLFGSISGSGVADVMITGVHTIPLMIRTGVKPHVAAAIESVSSTGAVFLPPIMGSAAFIMMEYTSVSYFAIMMTAIVPALLYYFSTYTFVHLEAKKAGLIGIPKDERPPLTPVLKQYGHLVIPVALLVVLIVLGYPLHKAVLYSIVAVVILESLRSLIVTKGVDFSRLFRALVTGATSIAMISAIAGSIGIVEAILNTTGLSSRVVTLLADLSGGNLFVLLLLVAVASVILGLGMVPTACYVLLGTLAAPALIDAGVNKLAAHFFVLYLGTLGAITPPVALSSYVAAGIAQSSPMRTALSGARVGIVGFIIPFMFALAPALVLQGTFDRTILHGITALTGVVLLNLGLTGFFTRNWSLKGRIMATAGGFSLIYPSFAAAIAGMVLGTVAILSEEVVAKGMDIAAFLRLVPKGGGASQKGGQSSVHQIDRVGPPGQTKS